MQARVVIASQHHTNVSQHAFGILNHVLVQKPHDSYAMLLQKSGTRLVVAPGEIAIVGCAIQFDCKPCTGTVEVDNEWTNTLLAAKLRPELITLKAGPQARFCGSQCLAQFAAARLEGGSIVDWLAHTDSVLNMERGWYRQMG